MFSSIKPTLHQTVTAKKDLNWTTGTSNQYSTDSSSCCESVHSFAEEEKPTEKTVRFSAMSRQRTIPSHKSFSTSMKSRLWHTGKEAEQFRKNAKLAASKARRVGSKHIVALDQICKDVCSLLASMEECEIDVLLTDTDFLYNMADILHGAESQDDDESLHGLEDIISAQRHFIRFEVGDDARAMVLEMSKYSRAYTAEETAQYYKEMSMSSVVLARIAAMADETAADKVYDDEK